MTCPACGGPLAAWRTVPGSEPGDPDEYELLRCSRCASAVTAGEPPAEETYEEGWYASRPPRGARAVAAAQRLAFRQPIRLLRSAGLPRRARVLDVGTGRGRLVAALREAGHDARGIEPSARGAESAEAAGLPVARETLEEHSDAGLDAVVMWHVLEHLQDPRAALERVRSWLRPGGLVLIGVPNLASLQAKLGGAEWFHLDVPRHRVHLTHAGTMALLHRSGLRPVVVSHTVWEHNPAGMWLALLTRLGMTPAFPFQLLKRNVRASGRDATLLGAGVLLAPLAVGLEAAAGLAQRGGTIAVVAYRPRD